MFNMGNAERKRQWDRDYHQLHADEIAARKRRWYLANRERIRAKQNARPKVPRERTPEVKARERARWRRRMAQPGARLKRREQLRKRRGVRAGHGWLYE